MNPPTPAETSVSAFTQTDLLCCPPSTPVSHAAALMRERRCGSIVVMDDGQPVGIWTEHDAARLNFADPAAFDAPVSSVMSAPLHTVAAGASLDEAAALFQRLGTRHLMVVNHDGMLGILSQTDVALRYGVDHFLRLRTVGESVTPGVLRVRSDLPLNEVAARIVAAETDAALVDYPDNTQGILTERDLLTQVAVRRGGGTAGDAASRPVRSITADRPLLDARRILMTEGYRHLAVTAHDQVTGLLSLTDIVAALNQDYVSSLIDVLRQRDEEILRSRDDLLLARQIIDSSANAVMVVSRDGIIQSVNPAFTRVTGLTAEQAVGHSPDALMDCDRQEADFFTSLCGQVGADGWRGTVWCRDGAGDLRAFAMTIYAISPHAPTPTPNPDSGAVVRYAAVFHDATANARIEEDKRIASIAFESVSPMILTDENARILKVNAAFTAMTGYPANEAVGQTPALLKSGRHDAPFYKAMWTELLANGHWQGEVWNRRRCGEIYLEWLSIAAVTDVQGRVTHYVGTLLDVTERQAAQDALREERDLIAAGPSVVFKWANKEGWPATFVSSNVERVFGHTPADLLSGDVPFASLVHPDDLQRVAGEVTAHLNAGTSTFHQHYRMRHADGSWRWIDDFTTVARDDDGTVISLNGYVIDVSDRVAAARAEQAGRDHMTQLLAALGEAVYGVDTQGRCTFINPAAVDLLGFAETEVVDRDQHLLFHHTKPDGTPYPHTECPIHQTLRDGQRREGEEAFIRKDGRCVPVHLTVAPLWHDGAISGAVVSFHDITARKAVQTALVAERERLANVIRGTRAATWEWNVQTGETIFNERWADMVGRKLADISPTTIETWMSFAHPEDLARSGEQLEKVFARELDYYECEARMRHKNGHWVWVIDRGKVVSWTEDGKPLWMAGTHTDITETKHAEEALRESEERYRLAQTATGVGIWDWDIIADSILWDANCWTMLGEEPSSKLQTYADWRDRVHPDDIGPAETIVQAQLAKGGEFIIEFRFRTGDGGWLWTQGRGKVVARDEAGTPTRMMGTHTDISTRKRVEQVLQDSRNRLDRLLGASPAVVYAASPATFQPTYISANASALFGLTPDEILCQPAWWLDSQHPEDRDRVLTEAEAWIANGAQGLLKHSYRLRRGDGSFVWVEDQLRALRDADGTIVELVGSHVDISAAKEAEAAVRQSEERLRALFAIFPDGVALYDVATRKPVQFNPIAAAQLGYTEAEFANLSIPDYEANENPDQVAEHIAEMLKQGGDDFETIHRRKDGSLMHAHVTVMSLTLNGRPHILAVIRDITERHRTQEELARSNAELEQFAYVASHDLRQPLRMVNSYTQLLERKLNDHLDDAAREFMGFIRDGAQRMDQMLVSLLEYSRVGRKGEPLAPVDSHALAQEAVRFLAPAITEAGGTVRLIGAEAGTWPQVLASRNEGVRLFQNLIGNAVKYRDPNRAPDVTVSVRRAEGMWEFSVADNGIGIDPRQFDRLFKVFQRLHTRSTYEGTGIGLAVCRKIVERHGGRIWVESEGEGNGTAFRFSLPDPATPLA